MKWIWFILCLSACGELSAQSSLNIYEEQKKEKAIGFLLSAIPGAGILYAGEDPTFYVASEALSVYWITQSENLVAPISVLILLRAGELLHVSQLIDKYNAGLRLNVSDRGALLRFEIRI